VCVHLAGRESGPKYTSDLPTQCTSRLVQLEEDSVCFCNHTAQNYIVAGVLFQFTRHASFLCIP
jgi:hypothetical protein